MFSTAVRPGLLSAVIMFVVFVFNYKRIKLYKNSIHYLVLAYLIYNTFTGLYFFFNQMPFSVFFMEYSNSIFPILFFYIGYSISEETDKSFIKSFTISGVFVILVGIYFLIYPNQMYFDFLIRTIPNLTAQNYLTDMRMNSFLGSTDVGTISSLLVVVSLSNIVKHSNISKNIFLFILACIGSALSMQRSSYAISIIMILILSLYGTFTRKISYWFIIVEILIIVLVLIYIFKSDNFLILQILYHTSQFDSAISDRSASWFNAVHNSPNIFLGSGLGTAGHKALEYAKYYVRDGNYFKILVEVGIIGLLLFIGTFIMTFTKYLKVKKSDILNICIISVFLFQAIGSNVLTFQTFLPVFWYFTGRIWNKNNKNIKYENNSILSTSISSN